jgi:hypothetical protein
MAALDKENSRENFRQPVEKAVLKPSANIDESFALNFSTFIDPKRGNPLDVTVSPTSFDLSNMSSSESDEDVNATNVTAGITATTFVLENRVHKAPEKESTVQLIDAKAEAVKQRQESENQLKEVEEKVRRLREKIENKEETPEETEQDVVMDSLTELMQADGKGGMHVPTLVRFASSPLLKRKEAAETHQMFKSANSTTDLKELRKKEGLNEDTKKARLNGLRTMGAPATDGPVSAPINAPVNALVDPTTVKARMKSRPQKLKMLRAISTLDAADFTHVEGFVTKSPSRTRGLDNLQNVGKDAVFHKMSWPGDEEEEEQEEAKIAQPGALFKKIEATSAPQDAVSDDEQEDESCTDDILSPLCEEPPTPKTANAAATAADTKANASESLSESMDEDMEVDLTMMENTVMHDAGDAGSRYSIFAAPPPSVEAAKPLVNKRLNLMDVKFDQAGDIRSTHQSLEQLDYVTKDPKLAGLFGEHLKGMRCDAILRLLDDIQEYKALLTEQERLSLARSTFQMYLSDSAAKENTISKEVVDAEIRAATRKKIRASQGPVDLFDEVEESVRYHLALKEMPEFVKGDVYRTLGFKKPRKAQAKKVTAQNAFAPVAAPVQEEPALFKKAEAVPLAEEETVVIAAPSKVEVEEEDEEDDNISDEEEESSDMSPVQKVAPAVAPVKASAAATIITRAKKQNLTPASAVMEELTFSETPSVSSTHDTTIDSILENAEERETFLSFVKSTDKRAAQKANANVSFLVKVAQFNKAKESERPTVARSIYDSYLATPSKKKNPAVARNQKGQVDVDVSELRKRQLVSRFRNMIENGGEEAAASPVLHKGFFDKAAKDVEAFVGPELNKYNVAKKNGTFERQKPVSSFPFAADVVMSNSPVPAPAPHSAPSPKMPTSLPKDFSLTSAFEQGGNIFEAFVSFSKDIGRAAPVEFLQSVREFKEVTDPVKRTPAAFYIMNTFLNRDGAQPLALPEHIRSGPQLRWDIFAKRNLIKIDFFDSVVTEVIKMQEKDTWPRFVAQANSSTTVLANRNEVSSFLSESSGIDEEEEPVMRDEEPSNFDFGITLQRNEIEEEIMKRLREEQEVREEEEEDSDSGVEDSPDAPGTESRIEHFEEALSLGLDLSPSTAADLLSRLDGGNDAMNDTVMMPKKKAALPSAQEAFEGSNKVVVEEGREKKMEPSNRPQTFIPVRRAVSEQTDMIAAQKRNMGIWPSRASKMMYGEGVECKKRIRFVVLKNKTLYVWASEMDYKKSKEPKRVLDMDDLVQLNIVRDHSSMIGVTKWTLRIKFDGLGFAVILASDSQQILSEWKKDLLESAPGQLTM